jgi:hypothetical protein
MKMKNFYLFMLVIFFAACKNDPNNPGNPNDPNGGGKPDPGQGTVQGVMNFLPKRFAIWVKEDFSQTTKIDEVDYVYQYLTGNIFDNSSWVKWNQPDGDYARIFLQQANQRNKIPVFTYYTIVAAKNRYADPAWINLNDAEVMKKHFENFKLLLDICKQNGKTVIVHYEPDMLGYLQIYKNENRPIKVDASGFADAKGYANNTKGLYQAIVAMRNKYASNVLLAWHASLWSTGKDLIAGKENPEALAAETIAFYKSLDAPFDLIFSDSGDRDAGFYEEQQGRDTWWSTQANSTNGNLSDFDRFQRYLKKMNQDSGQKIILWQIPIGNTLTRSCNNSLNHYKDNRVEYFFQPIIQSGNLDKLQQYKDAGVIAFLYGAGAGECTDYFDEANDGVTGAEEPADDDGGYLRKAIKAYYQKGPIAINQ